VLARRPCTSSGTMLITTLLLLPPMPAGAGVGRLGSVLLLLAAALPALLLPSALPEPVPGRCVADACACVDGSAPCEAVVPGSLPRRCCCRVCVCVCMCAGDARHMHRQGQR
jgi:hypothetical protein